MTWVEDWWQQAECASADPDLFLPERSRQGDWKYARAYCKACPVLTDCLEDAMKHPPVHDGKTTSFDLFQAGYTPQELTTLWRRRNRPSVIVR